jgi:hypothetical protein
MLLLLLLGQCMACQRPAEPGRGAPASEPADAPGPVQVFPHVWLEPNRRAVCIDGWTPIAPDNPNQGRVWLEVVLCPRDTKEHETLVVTEAEAAHVHAALLLLGLEPGNPGAWAMDVDGTYLTEAPTGPPVRVEFLYERDGEMVTADPRSWLIDAKTGAPPTGEWVFAGSKFVGPQERVYAADEEGTILGLSTFGTETLAWTEVHSPETSVEPPAYLANMTALPPFGTPVRVRLTPAAAP